LTARPRLLFSDAAVADVVEQFDWFNEQAGIRVAARWERAVTSTLFRLLRNPRTGALCHFAAEELRDLRRVPIAGFSKHLLFYRYRHKSLFVIRIVHGARDLERLF
jgi:toxin ParE1/3/4